MHCEGLCAWRRAQGYHSYNICTLHLDYCSFLSLGWLRSTLSLRGCWTFVNCPSIFLVTCTLHVHDWIKLSQPTSVMDACNSVVSLQFTLFIMWMINVWFPVYVPQSLHNLMLVPTLNARYTMDHDNYEKAHIYMHIFQIEWLWHFWLPQLKSITTHSSQTGLEEWGGPGLGLAPLGFHLAGETPQSFPPKEHMEKNQSHLMRNFNF